MKLYIIKTIYSIIQSLQMFIIKTSQLIVILDKNIIYSLYINWKSGFFLAPLLIQKESAHVRILIQKSCLL